MEKNAVVDQDRTILPVNHEEKVSRFDAPLEADADVKESDENQSGFGELETDLYGFAAVLVGVAILCQLKHLWEMLAGKVGATWSEPGIPLSILLGAVFAFCGGCITGGRYIVRALRKVG